MMIVEWTFYGSCISWFYNCLFHPGKGSTSSNDKSDKSQTKSDIILHQNNDKSHIWQAPVDRHNYKLQPITLSVSSLSSVSSMSS